MDDRVVVKQALEVTQETFETKYLGLPTPEGRMNKGKFKSLQDKLLKRLIQWGKIFLSQGGKEVLIKAVAQALPVYVMGIVLAPLWASGRIDKDASGLLVGIREGETQNPLDLMG
jgi:hypothetical protein